MNTFQPKSKKLGFVLIIIFYVMIVFLVTGLFIVSQNTFKKHSNEVVEIQTDEISRQIVYNYETFTDTLINTSNLIQETILNADITLEKNDIEQLFKHAIYLNTAVTNITLYDLDANLVVSGLNTETSYSNNEEWFIGAISDQTTHYFSSPKIISDSYILSISKLVPTNRHRQNMVLKIDVDFLQLIDITTKSNLGKFGHVTIISNNYEVIYTSRLESSISENEEKILFKENILGHSKVEINDNLMMFMIETITNTPWRIGIFINIQSSVSVVNNFLISLLIFSFLFSIVSSIIYFILAKTITNPLVKLQNRMTKIENTKDFILEPIKLNFPREVETLSHAFNIMMKRMDELIHEVINEKNEQRKSELRALQNQINPHFLYNTLDSIVWMVENNQNEDAVKMIVSLSRLFKISISGGHNLISVKNEIEHAKHYLFIQSFRYKDKFRYEVIIEDEEVLKETTLKLILQPLIENAIYHGIDKSEDNGKIILKAGYKDNFIKLSIEDNGYGLSEEKIKALYANMENNDLSDGVGIKNIYQRLKIYYPGKSSLIITSVLDKGTKIEILIPKGENI